MNDIAALDAFLQDIGCLKPITEWINRVNIFDVLRISRTEIRHSNMLAWLMDPCENHGLEERVLRGILRKVTDQLPADYSGFVIRREWNSIDLMAVSDSEKYVFCIENKIDTGEHDNQLERYKQLVDGTYSDYTKIQAYLTPSGKASSDPDHWLSLGYEDVSSVIDEAKQGLILQPEAELLIRNYLDVIRGVYRGKESVRETCAAIYVKHRQAIELILAHSSGSDMPEDVRIDNLLRKYRKELELIRRYRPGKSEDLIAGAIRSWTCMRTDEGKIEINLEKTSNATARFTTKVMSEILPDAPGRRSAWGTENFYFYEIRNTQLPSGEHELSIQLAIASQDIPDDLRHMCDRINLFFPAPQKKEDWAYRINYVTDHVILDGNADEEKVINQLDAFLEEVFAFERDLSLKLGK